MAELLKAVGYTKGDRLGIAVSGRVDADGNWYSVNKSTFAKLDYVPLRKMVAEQIGPASVANDAAAATLADALLGTGGAFRLYVNKCWERELRIRSTDNV